MTRRRLSCFTAERPAALLLACGLALLPRVGRAAPLQTPAPQAPAPQRTGATVAPLCVRGLSHAPPAVAGESFTYRLDLLGADVGSFQISIGVPPDAAPKAATLLLSSRTRTNAFVSTHVGRYEAFASTLIGEGLKPLSYTEEIDDGDTHRSQGVEFPPREGKLAVHLTVNGKPEELSLGATPAARDILSAWLAIRGVPLRPGTPFCTEVYAGKHMWRVSGSVAAKEQIDTLFGSMMTARIDTIATRADDPGVVRNAHVWVTDDARRLPVVAIAEVKGRTIRAQLSDAIGPNEKPLVAAKKTRREETREASGSAGIGRR